MCAQDERQRHTTQWTLRRDSRDF